MFKVGDIVHSKAFGEGTVTEIRKDVNFPVKVRFSNTNKQGYTSQGGYYQTEVDPKYDISLISRPETIDPDPSDLPVGSFGITSSMIVRITEIFSGEYRVCNLHSGGHSKVPKSFVMPLPDNITITNSSFEYILNEHKTKILATIVRTFNIDLIGIDGNYQILDKSLAI